MAAAQQGQAQPQVPLQGVSQIPSPQTSVQAQTPATCAVNICTDYAGTSKTLQNAPAHNAVGTEFWDNKVPPTSVLNDISKKCKQRPFFPSSYIYKKSKMCTLKC